MSSDPDDPFPCFAAIQKPTCPAVGAESCLFAKEDGNWHPAPEAVSCSRQNMDFIGKTTNFHWNRNFRKENVKLIPTPLFFNIITSCPAHLMQWLRHWCFRFSCLLIPSYLKWQRTAAAPNGPNYSSHNCLCWLNLGISSIFMHISLKLISHWHFFLTKPHHSDVHSEVGNSWDIWKCPFVSTFWAILSLLHWQYIES